MPTGPEAFLEPLAVSGVRPCSRIHKKKRLVLHSSGRWKFTKLLASMWHKAIWKGHPMRLELTRVGLLVELANHYTTRGAPLVRSIGWTTNSSQTWLFERILQSTVQTLLFCIYVLFIQYTYSTYFLFFRVFFLAPNRPEQLGDKGFAMTTGIKKGTLLKHWQTSFRERTNAKSQPEKKLVVHK